MEDLEATIGHEDILDWIKDTELAEIGRQLVLNVNILYDVMERRRELFRKRSRSIRRLEELDEEFIELNRLITRLRRQYEDRLDMVIFGTRARRYRVIEDLSDELVRVYILRASISNIDEDLEEQLEHRLSKIDEVISDWEKLLRREYWKMGIYNHKFSEDKIDVSSPEVPNRSVVYEIVDEIRTILDSMGDHWEDELRENMTPSVDPFIRLIELH